MPVRRDVAVAALVVAVLAIAAALVVAFAVVGNDRPATGSTAPDDGPIAVSASVAPRVALFGDTISARVDVTVDRAKIDPDSVRVRGTFRPWTPIGEPRREREDSGSTSYVRTTFVLRCLSALCVPADETSRYDFKPAKVTYEPPAGGAGERPVIDAFVPALFVHSRLDAASFTERDPLAAPWRADLVSLPAVTYRVTPWLLTALLSAGGALLILAAGVLGYPLLPLQREPPPEPPPPPRPILSPLEQALRLLETPPAEDGGAARRRALALVADELATWGDRRLEGRARALAWSEDTPAVEATRALAATVRERAGEEEGVNGVPA
jgi:hypothetical protein